MKRDVILIFALIMFISIICLNCVNFAIGLGISSPYYKGMPLVVSPGVESEVELGKLQNMVEGESDATLVVEVVEGEEIVKIAGDGRYFVPAGEKNVPVIINVLVPKNSTEGMQYIITLKFIEIDPVEGGGMIGFSRQTTKSIDVLVKEPEKAIEIKDVLTALIIFIAIIIVVIALMVLLRRKYTKL